MKKINIVIFIFGVVFSLCANAQGENYYVQSTDDAAYQPSYTYPDYSNNVYSAKSASRKGVIKNGLYVSLQMGYASSSYDQSWFVDPDNLIQSIDEVDKSGFAGRLVWGYKFTPYIATEMGIFFLPKIEFNGIKFYDAPVTIDESFLQSGIDLMLKGILPLRHGFDVYGKVGYAVVCRGDAEVSSKYGSITSDDVDQKSTVAIAAGASYHITPHIITDLSFMYYFGSGDLEPTKFFAFGIAYQFGETQ